MMKKIYPVCLEIKVTSFVPANSQEEAERIALKQLTEWNIPENTNCAANIEKNLDLVSVAYPNINVSYSEYQEKVFVYNGEDNLFSYSSLGTGKQLLSNNSRLLNYTLTNFEETLVDMATDMLQSKVFQKS